MSLRETETVRDNIYERESIRVSETETKGVYVCERDREKEECEEEINDVLLFLFFLVIIVVVSIINIHNNNNLSILQGVECVEHVQVPRHR